MKKTYAKYYFVILGMIMLWGMSCNNKGAKEDGHAGVQDESVRAPLNANEQNNKILIKKIWVIDVRLDKDYAYYLFKANKDYLVWYEGYTHTLYIYNLKEKELKNILLKKGRGPHEIKRISSIAITKDNLIYLVDYVNIKILRIRLSGEYLKDMVTPPGLHPMRIINRNNYQILVDPTNADALFFVHKEDQFIPIGKTDRNRPSNMFKEEGRYTIQNNHLVYLTKYLPYFRIYDLKMKKLVNKIKFDESHVDWGQNTKNGNGVVAMYPPSKVDILNEDIARVPGFSNRVFMLAKGASSNRKYGLDKLFEYDFKKEKFVATHKLGFKAQEIAVNDHYLFAYSKDRNKIYQYKLVTSK